MKKLVVVLLVVVILGLLCIWIFLPGKSVISLQQEKQALKNLLGRDANLTPQVTPTTWNTHKSAYLLFTYPSWAKVYADDNVKAIKNGALDSFAFALLDEHTTAVVQAFLLTGQLSEYPAVALRLSAPDTYKTVGSTSASKDSITFRKDTDTPEESAFFMKNGKVVSVAVTGYSREKVGELYNKLIASLKVY